MDERGNKGMKIKRMFTTVDTHVEGNPVRTVTGGLPFIPGKTVVEKTLYLKENADWIRKMLMNGPRSNENQSGIILTEPCCSQADAGIIYMDGYGFENISKESIIGVSTAMIESGLVDIVEPYTNICLETNDGLIQIKAKVEDEAAIEIAFKSGIQSGEEVSGRAFITGMHTFTLDPEDPVQ